jgi:hypothetical protein
MAIQTLAQLIPVLQTAIGPVILISGIGLLLLTMTNRYGRVIDRSRMLIDDLAKTAEEGKDKIKAQVRILWRRTQLIRYVIALSAISALTAAMLIIFLFIIALWQIDEVWFIVGLFMVCLVSLIGSLILFLYDINLSLAALKLELEAEGINET